MAIAVLREVMIEADDLDRYFEGKVPVDLWRAYNQIPRGTELPDGLVIVRDELNERWGATHYTLAPAYDMPLSQFVELLSHLARTLARGGRPDRPAPAR